MASKPKQAFTVAQIETVVAELRRRADSLAGFARRMQDDGCKAAHAQGYKGVTDGFESFDKFIANLRKDRREI
jgi:hypothetical protein